MTIFGVYGAYPDTDQIAKYFVRKTDAIEYITNRFGEQELLEGWLVEVEVIE